MNDSIKDILGGHEVSKPPKKLKHIVHRRTENGGHVFEHHFTHPEHHKMEEHVHSDTDNAVSHFIDHGTDENPGEAEANMGQSGIEEGAAPQKVPGI